MTREERMLHGAYNVGDLDKATKKSDVPEDRYSNAFLGYGREDSTLELTYSLTPETLCQVMLRVGDLDRSIDFYKKVRSNQCCKKSAEAVKLCGGKIVHEPGPITCSYQHQDYCMLGS
nr:probable lactoylglutathione lyase, chloroplastic [Populus alba]